jgi:hypothetical protein
MGKDKNINFRANSAKESNNKGKPRIVEIWDNSCNFRIFCIEERKRILFFQYWKRICNGSLSKKFKIEEEARNFINNGCQFTLIRGQRIIQV